MNVDKNLFFIPIIARALESDDPKGAMEDAFEKIKNLGQQDEYKEGYRQFMEFIKTALAASETSGEGVESVKDAIYRLFYDLATDTFEGDEKQREVLIAALRKNTGTNAAYLRIPEEVKALFSPEPHLKIEVLRKNQIMGSLPVSSDPAVLGSVIPGKYTLRFSSGRILWEGELAKEDLIWAFAFPGKDLAMAAETEVSRRKPTRIISLLDGEMTLSVFAGIEAGQIKIESEQVD